MFSNLVSPEEIERHLPEHGINGIFHQPREPVLFSCSSFSLFKR
jgi:hypothetical protein